MSRQRMDSLLVVMLVRIQTVRALDKYLFIIIDIFGQLLSIFYCASLREHTSYGYLYPRVLTS